MLSRAAGCFYTSFKYERLAGYEEHASVRAEVESDGRAEVVREALGRLSASSREVIYLRFYDGLSYERISAVLGLSEEAVNGRLRRAKRKMAGLLRREGFGEARR